MDESLDPNIKWIPFLALALSLLVITGFWKLEKNREEPIMSMEQYVSGQGAQGQSQGKAKMEGKMAPDFSLPTYDGKTITLSDYRGKVVFLNIWATWCPPCKEEMPSMQRMHERYKDGDFAMITISIDEETKLVEPFMKELGLTFPVALDPDQKVASQYAISGVPETYIINREGLIMHHLLGPGEWDNAGIFEAFDKLVFGDGGGF